MPSVLFCVLCFLKWLVGGSDSLKRKLTLLRGEDVITRGVCTTIVVMLLTMALPAKADNLVARAASLLQEGQSAAAFAVLDAEEHLRAGDPEFDLLLGVAAIDVGQNTRAVFALERVLAVQPGHARARAELARAYLALGDTTGARKEFESVQKQGVPPEVVMTIDRFLDAVDRVESVNRPTLRGFVEAAGGFDSNVNVAPGRSTVAIPGFGGLPFRLADNSRATDAWFGSIGGGANYRKPLTREFALVAGAAGVLRNNAGAQQFDSLNLDAYAGFVLSHERHVVSANYQFNQYDAASNRYRLANGVSGQWQYNADSRNQFSAYFQYSNLNYPGQEVRDADRWVAGAAYAHALRSGTVFYASAYGLSERPRDGDMMWLGFGGYGLRAGWQMNLNAQTEVFFAGSAESRRYSAHDASFQTRRSDAQYDLALGVNYVPVRLWKVTPRVTWTQNESNIDLYKYHRATASVVVRRDF